MGHWATKGAGVRVTAQESHKADLHLGVNLHHLFQGEQRQLGLHPLRI